MGIFRSKPVCFKTLVLGLDGAGKTTLLYKLRLKGAQADFQATKGFNYEQVSQRYQGIRYALELWDLAGRAELRKCWRYYYNSMNIGILIYVVSARDRGRLKESANEFRMLRYETNMLSTNRVVILNSFAVRDTDLAHELSTEDLREHFGEDIAVISMNVRDPGHGMRTLFRWISEQHQASRLAKSMVA
jgi:small GTP-binding protein